MERYGDDAQRRMRTEDHVPSGHAGHGGGGSQWLRAHRNRRCGARPVDECQYRTACEMYKLFLHEP